MDPYFRQMFEALKQTAEGLIQANEGIKKLADAALTARDEHEDLRETVSRLETTVLDLVKEVRELREGEELMATKRPYSFDYTARANPRRYLLSGIPPTLWQRARARAKREGVSMRSLILSLLEAWAVRPDVTPTADPE